MLDCYKPEGVVCAAGAAGERDDEEVPGGGHGACSGGAQARSGGRAAPAAGPAAGHLPRAAQGAQGRGGRHTPLSSFPCTHACMHAWQPLALHLCCTTACRAAAEYGLPAVWLLGRTEFAVYVVDEILNSVVGKMCRSTSFWAATSSWRRRSCMTSSRRQLPRRPPRSSSRRRRCSQLLLQQQRLICQVPAPSEQAAKLRSGHCALSGRARGCSSRPSAARRQVCMHP